ncbi:cytidine deaminase family protein [Jannaschia sp. R86511]|uniref:cytidine deaminase family protein n=1 Tax=Jannaschia sp. R86511 TaxID=3093853 RepID=UPI0036D3E48B
METASPERLSAIAAEALNSQDLGSFFVGDVACALQDEEGKIWTGACVGGHLGLCAEQSAVSAMVSAGPPIVRTIVAVWRDEHGDLFVLPPCGRCREFLHTMSQRNLDTAVVLGPDHVVPLRDLLPSYGWHAERWSPHAASSGPTSET